MRYWTLSEQWKKLHVCVEPCGMSLGLLTDSWCTPLALCVCIALPDVFSAFKLHVQPASTAKGFPRNSVSESQQI